MYSVHVSEWWIWLKEAVQRYLHLVKTELAQAASDAKEELAQLIHDLPSQLYDLALALKHSIEITYQMFVTELPYWREYISAELLLVMLAAALSAIAPTVVLRRHGWFSWQRTLLIWLLWSFVTFLFYLVIYLGDRWLNSDPSVRLPLGLELFRALFLLSMVCGFAIWAYYLGRRARPAPLSPDAAYALAIWILGIGFANLLLFNVPLEEPVHVPPHCPINAMPWPDIKREKWHY